MAGMSMPEGFYEDDEPVQDVVAAFEGGERGVTRPPILIETAGLAAPDTATAAFPARVFIKRASGRPILVRGVV